MANEAENYRLTLGEYSGVVNSQRNSSVLKVLRSLSLFWAELMINKKGFKKSLKYALLSSSLFIFFKSEVASETEVIGIRS